MCDVAIIGAGDLGGALAHLLARRDTASAITLVDDTTSIAAGKALDIAEAAPIERFSTRVSGTRDLHRAAGADIVVVADRAGGTEWHGIEGGALVRRLVALTPESIVLCAGASQREMVENGVREGGAVRQRLLGSAPEALVGAMKALVALEVNGSPGDVGLTILGIPPDRVIVPWDDASIGGLAAWRTLDAGVRRRLGALVPRLWPPGPVRPRSGRVVGDRRDPRTFLAAAVGLRRPGRCQWKADADSGAPGASWERRPRGRGTAAARRPRSGGARDGDAPVGVGGELGRLSVVKAQTAGEVGELAPQDEPAAVQP